jgi:hypothetical protein
VAIVFAQMIVEAPKYGASNRAAAISAPRLADPTQNAIRRSRQNAGETATGSRPFDPIGSRAGLLLVVTLTWREA